MQPVVPIGGAGRPTVAGPGPGLPPLGFVTIQEFPIVGALPA